MPAWSPSSPRSVRWRPRTTALLVTAAVGIAGALPQGAAAAVVDNVSPALERLAATDGGHRVDVIFQFASRADAAGRHASSVPPAAPPVPP